MDTTEVLARAWITCDPNRSGSDPDERMPDNLVTGGTDVPTTEVSNPMAGQPRWKWFVPRAEATVEFLRRNGYEVRRVKAP